MQNDRNKAREAWESIQDLPWKAAGGLGVVLRALLGARSGYPLAMLTYHRVAPPADGLPLPEHNVVPQKFRQQLEGLLARGYSFLPLRKVLAIRDSGDAIPPQTVVLTFDDAYETVYTNAWPILQDLGIPATAFVSTAFLDSDDPFPFDEWGTRFAGRAPASSYRPLRRQQCLEMWEDGLVEIGAHTHTHQDFRGRPEDFVDDLQNSVAIVRDMLGKEDITFAFPFGLTGSNDELLDAARATGVSCGLTTAAAPIDPGSDPFGWGRFTAFPFDTAATLAGKLDGRYSWAPRLRQRFSRSA